MASESKEQVVWYGGENNHQDVWIRLVRNTINNEVDDRPLASLMLHSSRLETCSSYFAALSQRWSSKRKRSPQELTFHVHGDVRLYTDCFSRMYHPLMVGFESVKYSLQLLEVATHLEYDDLMSSICLYLAASPWSDVDEMRIRNSLLSEAFPRGHAQDLLERLESRLNRDDLRPLITRCMEGGIKSFLLDTSSFSVMELARQASDLLVHLLVTARGQERSPTPTFEQEAVSVINEEFKLLLVAADVEVEAADTMEDNPGLMRTLDIIQQVMDTLLNTGMADEAVKCFAQYTSFPKLIGDAVRSELNDVDAMLAVDAFIWTVVTMVKDVVGTRNVHVDVSVRDALLLNWLPLLNWLQNNADAQALAGIYIEYLDVFVQVKQALLSIRPSSEDLKKMVNKVLAS